MGKIHFSLFFVFTLWAMMPPVSNAQQSFDKRIEEIQDRLNNMTDSVAIGLEETTDFSVVNASLQELLRGVAEAHNLNISISPGVNARITNNFTRVKVKDLIIFLCREYKLDIVFFNNIFAFKPFEQQVVKLPKPRKMPDIIYENGMLRVDLKRDSLSVFAKELARVSGKNIVIDPDVDEKLLNGYISNVPFAKGLERIAYANALAMEESEDGFFIIKNRTVDTEETSGNNANRRRRGRTGKGQERYKPGSGSELYIEITPDSMLNVEAINVPIVEVVKEAFFVMGYDYVLFSPPEGNTVIRLQHMHIDHLIEFLLHGTDHTYKKEQGVYLIGNRTEEGFRSTRLVRFQFRTVTEVDKLIPNGMVKNIQITPFEELNALILSGSATRINEIVDFLKAMDQPVPNIMIEVIVVDVRKGRTISTGLSAGLSDSVVSTAGQIFPGLDLTLGSGSINEALENVGSIGPVNLGRVAPNFYATLQALEQNDNIKIRSTPKLSTLNAHEAILTIGESVYYLQETQNVSGSVNTVITTTPTFNKVDANLNIKIKPMVSGDDNVTLDIEAEFSDFIPAEIENAPPGNATRKFVSKIRVKNEEMIILGGLEEIRKEENNSGAPLLARIPILKWLFSQKSDTKRKDKLVIFIKPTIVY